MLKPKYVFKRKYVGGFGQVLCRKCGVKGTLYCYVMYGPRRYGPYWQVTHKDEEFVHTRLAKGKYMFTRTRGIHKTCYLGQLTDAELDEVLMNRPWPLSAAEAWEKIKNVS